MSQTAPAGRAVLKFKIHWHVLVTHFPIALFLASAAFMALHLFTATECFELAGYIMLAGGAIMLVPAVVTGWITWKGRYRGVRGKIFVPKIRIAYAMVGLSAALLIFRGFFVHTEHTLWHFVYGVGFVILFLGALAEGYYGGRLNHR